MCFIFLNLKVSVYTKNLQIPSKNSNKRSERSLSTQKTEKHIQSGDFLKIK